MFPKQLGKLPVTAACTFLAVVGCRSAETKECHSLMSAAQVQVNEVQAGSLESVEASLKAVEAALLACTAAGKDGEAAKLADAKKELADHLERLKSRGERAGKAELSPEELAKLERNGDPNCPKGQAYKHKQSGKEIRCVGPHPLEMPWARVEDYFSRRGYKMHTESAPPALKAEYGAELLVFEYAAVKDSAPPRCLVIYPAPGISWQEATARLTGARPDRLENGGTVTTQRGKLPVHVDEGKDKLIVRVGECRS